MPLMMPQLSLDNCSGHGSPEDRGILVAFIQAVIMLIFFQESLRVSGKTVNSRPCRVNVFEKRVFESVRQSQAQAHQAVPTSACSENHHDAATHDATTIRLTAAFSSGGNHQGFHAARAAGAEPLDRLGFLAIGYLALPNFIFLLGWLNPYYGWPLCTLLGMGMGWLWTASNAAEKTAPHPGVAWLVLVAAVWPAFGGAGHFFYANFDWITRDAVLRDLSLLPWPVTYGMDNESPLILRCPIGYYLPSALLSKWIGVGHADFLLWVWTVIGVGLFLALLPFSKRSAPRFWLGVAVVVLFSGMDILGALQNHEWPAWDTHLEWWAGIYQYSSHSTQLFWVPNHALPAWLAAALCLRHWRDPRFLQWSPLLIALLPIWTPFALIGMAPFMILPLYIAIHYGYWQTCRAITLIPAICLLAVMIPYLLLDIGGIPGGILKPGTEWLATLSRYFSFVGMEFGLLAILLWRLQPGPPFWLALLVLLLLPMVSFGPGNDLVMRASIPALLVVCVAVLKVIDNPTPFNDPVRVAFLTVILLLGSVTPIHEFVRAVTHPAWRYDPASGLAELRAESTAYPPHYVAHLNRSAVATLLKTLPAAGLRSP